MSCLLRREHPNRSAGGLSRARHRRYFVSTALCLLAAACSSDPPTMPPDPNTPVFTTMPRREADHNREYRYTFNATDPNGDSLVFTATHPTWITFDPNARTLAGLADWDNVGTHPITIAASDGSTSAVQRYTLTVVIGEIICSQPFGDPDSSLYILPYPAGKTYRVTQSYCNSSGGHNNTFAYDFDTQIGDTIIAARAGVVIVANDQFADGDITSGNENNVFIEHEDGTAVRYTHLMHGGALVAVGDSVAQGEPIGLSGNTGNTGNVPHLHFAVYRDRTSYMRQYSIPVNFRNADGVMDSHDGLIMGVSYTALPAGAGRR